MDISQWPAAVQGSTPSILIFLGACLVIVLAGGLVRAISQAVGGGGNDDD